MIYFHLTDDFRNHTHIVLCHIPRCGNFNLKLIGMSKTVSTPISNLTLYSVSFHACNFNINDQKLPQSSNKAEKKNINCLNKILPTYLQRSNLFHLFFALSTRRKIHSIRHIYISNKMVP